MYDHWFIHHPSIYIKNTQEKLRMNKNTILQSYLHDLFDDHQALPIHAELVQDNARGLRMGSSMSMMYLSQQQLHEDEMFLSDADNNFHRHADKLEDKNKDHLGDGAHEHNKQSHGDKMKKKKKFSDSSNSSSSKHPKKKKMINSEGSSFTKKSIRRSVSEDGTKDNNLLQRARELLLETAGGFGGGGASGSNNDKCIEKKKGVALRRNSWSNDKIPTTTTPSRDWEEYSDSQLPIPVRRTSDGEMANADAFHKKRENQRMSRTSLSSSRSLNSTFNQRISFPPSRSLDSTLHKSTATTDVDRTEDAVSAHTVMESCCSNSRNSPGKSKDTSLKVPIRRAGTMDMGTSLLNEHDNKNDERILVSEEKVDTALQHQLLASGDTKVWYDRRHCQKNSSAGDSRNPTASKLKEALDIAATL